MKQKIEWYQEVLELEPGSKVFFPLAKMLVADGQTDAAIAALRRGTDRHPEFIEARLFLVELLHKNGQDEPRNAEAARLAEMFSAYPAFWAAWGAVVMAGEDGPQGTALLLLAAAMREQNISWNDIIDTGVRNLIGAVGVGSTVAPSVPLYSVRREAAQPAAAIPPAPAKDPANGRVSLQDAAVESVFTDEDIEAAFPPDTEEETAPGELLAEEPSGDEHLSVRTRSMAEVLVEQGDLRGAKEIYEELLQSSKNPAISADLKRRIEDLDERMGRLSAAGATHKAEEAAPASSGKDKVVNMLQLLASRLENRAS